MKIRYFNLIKIQYYTRRSGVNSKKLAYLHVVHSQERRRSMQCILFHKKKKISPNAVCYDMLNVLFYVLVMSYL